MRDDTSFAAASFGTPWEPDSISTLGLPPSERFNAWRSYYADVVDLSPGDEPIRDFPAEFTRWEFGGLTLTRAILEGAPERSWRHVPRSYKDHWCLVLAGPSAGADPWEGDRLGRLALTKEGLRTRDELVLDRLRAAGAAVCVVLAGGYAEDVRDTVEINVNTLRVFTRLDDAVATDERISA